MNHEWVDSIAERIDERIENYLDGVLDQEDARRFEQDLLKEEVAAQFREALLLRELLGSLPPDQPPQGLARRIEAALIAGHPIPSPEPEADTAPGSRFGRFVATFKAGLSWPGYAISGMSGQTGALKGSVGGMQTIGYFLGPLRVPARKGVQAIRGPQKPLWKIALSKVWQGVS